MMKLKTTTYLSDTKNKTNNAMTKTPYKTVSSKAALKHGYVDVTDFYDTETESDMLDRAIETFRGAHIALVSDGGGERIQIWRKADEVKLASKERRY